MNDTIRLLLAAGAGIALAIVIIGFGVALSAQERIEDRFATSTLDIAQIEQVEFLEQSFDALLREQKITNQYLDYIAQKL